MAAKLFVLPELELRNGRSVRPKYRQQEYLPQEDYAAAIQKGNTDLLNAVNGALKELKEDGTIQKILDKYIK